MDGLGAPTKENDWGSKLISGKKTHLVAPFYVKTIILPRQARDRHRESTQKESGV
eukprot:COSAG06_NODE_8242_length_2225_cov_5.165569_1_plen_54_part_10